MNWRVCLSVLAVATSMACGGGKGGGGSAGGGSLTITATPPTGVLANGVNTVIVHVEGSTKGPIVIRTDRGHFQESGAVTATNPTTPFDVTLVTCDSQVVAGCAGFATVNASDQNLATGRIQVRFVQVEMCANGLDDDGDAAVDCADADCAAKTCGTNGLTCGAANLCECPSGQAHELPAQCSAAAPIDNDCDGKAGCADSDCLGLTCATGTAVFGTCKAGGACTCVATPGPEAACGDGIDNDCDGLIDCDDADCVGKVCDGLGLTCAGNKTCSVCGGNGGTPEAAEASCADGKDNDCDGNLDCADADCAAITCNATGRTCDGLTQTCVCNKPEASGEVTCTDGLDNDCDGIIDCKDTNCQVAGPVAGYGLACGSSGRYCQGAGAAGTCACTGNGGTPQATESTCSDGADNDCDGAADCTDTDCRAPSPLNPLTGGKDCSSAGRFGDVCSYSGVCSCTGNGGTPEVNEVSCGDGKDNDCNTLIDCKDPGCYNAVGASCGLNGRVCAATPSGNPATPGSCVCSGNGGAAEATEASCGDGFDNDCDGTIDCADTDCAARTCGLNGRTCAGTACTCSGNGGAAQPAKETSCGDGFDNDCDGLVDCADTDCRPVGNNPGAVCDTLGNTCSPPSGNVSTCSICSGNGGTAQAIETACGDGKDNDCDGQADCQDANCASLGLTCDSTGKVCSSGQLCRCADTSGVESLCGDGLDNDCDGFTDFRDLDCNGQACKPNGFVCSTASNGNGSCICSGNGGTAQPAKETSCGDGFDNDCDGAADCGDLDCRPTVVGTFGQACSTVVLTSGAKCDISGQCACPGGQTAESSCADGLDNDCDGFLDCADSDCFGKACARTPPLSSFGTICTVTSVSGCNCPGGQATETTCGDGLDNDCDGKADCDDLDCAGALCQASPSTYTCLHPTSTATNYVCKDGSTYTLALTAASSRIPADGMAATNVTAFLQQDLAGVLTPVRSVSIGFATSSGSLSSASATTGLAGSGADGKASVTYTSAAVAGTARVTATYAGVVPNVVQTFDITLPALSSISLTEQEFTVMGARDSGYHEINQLTFLLTDGAGKPYPAGLRVDFDHTPSGLSSIEVVGSTTTCTPSSCTTSGVTDANGYVRVLLHSGSLAGPLAVTATANAGGTGPKTVTASNITVVGAKANGNEFTITCSPQNVPALVSTDCTNSVYFGNDANVTCRVVMNDRFKNKLGVATSVQFFTEAGSMGTSATTPAYRPGEVNLGTASSIYTVSGAKLPVDVLPDLTKGEKWVDHDWDGCAQSTPTLRHNPRDGLVSIMVMATGEEGFFDGSNGCPANGVYDSPGSLNCASGESFVDLGEPFVDGNDNGVRDSLANPPPFNELDEYYYDANNDGSWTGPNGVWDSTATLWAETRILYSGYVERQVDYTVLPPMEQASRIYTTGPMPDPTPVVSFRVDAADSTPPANAASTNSYLVYMTDKNLNLPNYQTTYALSKTAGAKFTSSLTPSPTTTDGLGMQFRQLYCDGATPANCATSCNWVQCLRKADVGGFTYGSFGGLTVTGGAQADPASVCTWVTATLRTTNTISNITTDRSIDVPICGYNMVPIK